MNEAVSNVLNFIAGGVLSFGWLAGVVYAAVVIPFYAWYLVVERILLGVC